MSPEALAEKILERLKGGPLHFEDILLQFREEPYRVVLQAWGRLREAGALGRELETGRYTAADGEDQDLIPTSCRTIRTSSRDDHDIIPNDPNVISDDHGVIPND